MLRQPFFGVEVMYPKVAELRLRSTGPNEAIPMASYSRWRSQVVTLPNVSEGDVVSIEITSVMFAGSPWASAQRNVVSA